jgi:hypothetical protein
MNQNPTDSDGRPMVVGADYYLDDDSPNMEYKGQVNDPILGWKLHFRTLDNKKIDYRPVDYHPVLIRGQAGGRRKSKSKSKRRKTKRRKSRKNKSKRRR